ncbi:PD-(D/E)XK nuclease-like domain-containing protein, partial [Candidatus Pacearchaeota archaeon]|nr:PD-(D/E)XK nuclease-like domain-containing protein [Candidatus Pacearchaeota archaeon]
MEQGIYNMSDEEYHSLDISIVSNSYLSRLDKCPAFARVKQETTPIMELGRAVHCYILEGPDKFDATFAVSPSCDRRYKKGKEIWADFVEANPGKTVITEENYIKIYGMDKAVKSHPFAGELLADGVAEQAAFWTDEETGIKCKCKVDWIPSGHNILVDLKSTQNSGEYEFAKSAATYRYINQAALYGEGFSKAAGTQYDAFVFVAVEKEFPYRTEVYVIDEEYLAYGQQ